MLSVLSTIHMVTDGTNPRKVISCRLSYGLAGDPWLANCRVSRDGDVNSSYSYYSTHAAREGSKWTWRHRTTPWPRPRAGTRASVSTAGRRAGPGASAGSSTAPSSASPSTGPAPTASPSRSGQRGEGALCNVTMVTVWQVRYSPSVGRYLVAARDIRPLELVLWDAAAAVGPSADREAVLGMHC